MSNFIHVSKRGRNLIIILYYYPVYLSTQIKCWVKWKVVSQSENMVLSLLFMIFITHPIASNSKLVYILQELKFI